MYNTDFELNDNFYIASIEFIAANKPGVGLGSKVMKLSLDVLKYMGVEKVVIQLLNPSVNRPFYEKFDFIELKNINQK